MIEVPLALAKRVLAYLANRPYVEVFELIREIEALPLNEKEAVENEQV